MHVPTLPQPVFYVLHVLALKRAARWDVLAAATRMPTDTLKQAIDQLDARGYVRWQEQEHSLVLTDDGREAHRQALPIEVGAGGRHAVADVHARFLALNPGVLDLVTRWQVRTVGNLQVPNDHSDAEYDRRCVEDLAALHCQAVQILRPLIPNVRWFGTYPARLSCALRHVHAGDLRYFTGLEVESYHTLWFELHQDLLMTLGLDRNREGVPS